MGPISDSGIRLFRQIAGTRANDFEQKNNSITGEGNKPRKASCQIPFEQCLREGAASRLLLFRQQPRL